MLSVAESVKSKSIAQKCWQHEKVTFSWVTVRLSDSENAGKIKINEINDKYTCMYVQTILRKYGAIVANNIYTFIRFYINM